MPSNRQKFRAAVVAKRGRRCMYCGSGPLHRKALRLDYVKPVSEDNLHDPDCVVVACSTCLDRKGRRAPLQYADERVAALRRELSILTALQARFAE